ncbi:MAG: phosphopyruvate hydratase [Alphaproteobacteria bacterium 33-17]|nr:MAG: phosphopyruvate hydratase [Alphaproteobacteria bacterium 33-17]
MSYIVDLKARQIFDSRGNPTVECDIILEDGVIARAAVPSGASVGSFEALELRDNDKYAYNGKGVTKAVDNINNVIAPKLLASNLCNQADIDNFLLELDGNEYKTTLGANATLAVSMAAARAGAYQSNLPLFQYLGGVNARKLPVPMMNIINGGAHADNGLFIQEFMIAPLASTYTENLKIANEVTGSLRSILKKDGYSTNVGDEGGFAPDFNTANQALDFLMQAIDEAGYNPGRDVLIALDAAATEFYHDGKYVMGDLSLSSEELVDFYKDLAANYPIFSIEDGMAEDDNEGWKMLTQALGKDIQLVGDDLFVTNAKILGEGIRNNIANAILIKPNQIGTVTETLNTIELAKINSYKTVISHRSGETEDSFIAHLAVAVNSGQIKTGALARSDRVAKYNELLRIEEILGRSAYIDTSVVRRK